MRKNIFILIGVIIILFTNYSTCFGINLINDCGIDVELLSGNVNMLGSNGNLYGGRIGYWPTSFFNIGFEGAIVPKVKDYTNFTRYHLFTGLHFRKLKYLNPYIIGTVGLQKEPILDDFDEGIEDSYKNKIGLSIKFGLACEISRMRFAIEYGGGDFISGHEETNISIGYIFKELPQPHSLNGITVSTGIQNYSGFTGVYSNGTEDGFQGFVLNYENNKDGKIKEYNLGIIFLIYNPDIEEC